MKSHKVPTMYCVESQICKTLLDFFRSFSTLDPIEPIHTNAPFIICWSISNIDKCTGLGIAPIAARPTVPSSLARFLFRNSIHAHGSLKIIDLLCDRRITLIRSNCPERAFSRAVSGAIVTERVILIGSDCARRAFVGAVLRASSTARIRLLRVFSSLPWEHWVSL